MKLTGLSRKLDPDPLSSAIAYMTNKEVRKVQFGRYNKKRYKEIRKKLKVREEKELNIKIR